MNATMARIQREYTSGARRLVADIVARLTRVPVSANTVTVIGFFFNVAAAVLIYRELWIAAGVVFLIGSILDVFDGAIARNQGTDGPRGSFFDSTVDRAAESIVLAAIAIVFARQGNTVALAATFAALAFSGLTSYARAKAEALGLDGTSGLMARAERVVLLGATLLFAPLHTQVLPIGIYILAALSALTVIQRVRFVYAQLDD